MQAYYVLRRHRLLVWVHEVVHFFGDKDHECYDDAHLLLDHLFQQDMTLVGHSQHVYRAIYSECFRNLASRFVKLRILVLSLIKSLSKI